MSDDTHIAFIGLGNMGAPMARRLVDAGHRVHVWDTSERARTEAIEFGATESSSSAAATHGAAVVVLMLPDSGVVEAVVLDPTFLASLAPGVVIVDMSSSEPGRTKMLAKRLDEQGVLLVDAPVSGGVGKARSGELAVMVGGSDSAVDSVAHILSTMGRIFRAGPVGSGHAVKALNNWMSATHLLITSEAMLAGMHFGLDPEAMLEIVNASSGRSGSTENKWPNFVIPETFDSGFALRLMLKDMRIAQDLAEQMGTPHTLGGLAVDIWDRASAQLPADADHTEIARWLRADLPGQEI